MTLNVGIQTFRGCSTKSGRKNIKTITQQRGSSPKRQRSALHNHRGTCALPKFTADHGQPPGHTLHYPVILCRAQKRKISLDSLTGNFGHFSRRQARIYPGLFQRLVQPVDMRLQTENLSGKSALSIKYRVPENEPAVSKGHTDLGFRKILPVEIRYSFHQYPLLVVLPGLWYGNAGFTCEGGAAQIRLPWPRQSASSADDLQNCA